MLFKRAGAWRNPLRKIPPPVLIQQDAQGARGKLHSANQPNALFAGACTGALRICSAVSTDGAVQKVHKTTQRALDPDDREEGTAI